MSPQDPYSYIPFHLFSEHSDRCAFCCHNMHILLLKPASLQHGGLVNNTNMHTRSQRLSPKRTASHLGTAWGEGPRDSKQHTLLALEQLCQIQLVPRMPFKHHHRWDGITHLEGRSPRAGSGSRGQVGRPREGRQTRARDRGLVEPGLTEGRKVHPVSVSRGPSLLPSPIPPTPHCLVTPHPPAFRVPYSF